MTLPNFMTVYIFMAVSGLCSLFQELASSFFRFFQSQIVFQKFPGVVTTLLLPNHFVETMLELTSALSPGLYSSSFRSSFQARDIFWNSWFVLWQRLKIIFSSIKCSTSGSITMQLSLTWAKCFEKHVEIHVTFCIYWYEISYYRVLCIKSPVYWICWQIYDWHFHLYT